MASSVHPDIHLVLASCAHSSKEIHLYHPLAPLKSKYSQNTADISTPAALPRGCQLRAGFASYAAGVATFMQPACLPCSPSGPFSALMSL